MARSFSSVISSERYLPSRYSEIASSASRHVRLGSFGCGPRHMSPLRHFIDSVFELQRLQPDQFVSWLHLRTALDHPDDGDLRTSDFAFDFRVLGALQSPLFGYRDDQVATRDRVSQLGTDLPRRSGAVGSARQPTPTRRRHRSPADRVSTIGLVRNPEDRCAVAAAAVGGGASALLEARQST